MMATIYKHLLGAAAAATMLAAPAARAEPASDLSPAEAGAIAIEAYVYGYSLVTSEVTRVQMSNVDKVEGLHAPAGQFVHVKRYPPAAYRGISAPNADTLYSVAWLDLGAEPIVFSHPDMGNRYFLFPMYSLWMPVVESPGRRTAGGGARTYLIAGPEWRGKVPDGMTEIRSPTRHLVILGRTYADGSEADYAKVHALQAQYRLTPLSAFGKPYEAKPAPVDPNPGYSMTDKPQTVILDMGTKGYFDLMARLMCKDAPAAPADAAILARMARIGLAPCKSFDIDRLDPEVQASLPGLPQAALEKIEANKPVMGERIASWTISKGLGRYETDYMKRAVVAAFGWPANLQEDAVYPYAEKDSDGQPLDGKNNYTLTFAKGQLPPVDGFWSLTMYQVDRGWWFVDNPLNRFTISQRDALRYNPDGSLTLYLQHDTPGKEREANWLPTPKGAFVPMLRMFQPKTGRPSVFDGSWRPPAIVRSVRR
ncbi:DUF1254 domain-containing protein [Sphingopyxis sp. JAI108]|uniref:DUF1254 domain-containing protein n=1 Tax=Sphingopyxis sp. JAI108 TaxID=2723060 RepID=UPI0017C37DA5|nr:DUF1254 domain-containing protein [Sphingopyxis sp. JAI108]NYF32627.1 hypothetical protein [Sphingopyxis sp. JAI108]